LVQIVGFTICISRTIARYRNENNQDDSWAETLQDRVYHRGKGKGKAVPLQAWTGPEGSRRLRIADFKTIGT